MVKTIYILLAAVLFTACVSKRETLNTTSASINYEVMPEAKVSVNGGRLWLLFIPIGLGSFKHETQREKAIHRFLKHNNADAIASGELVHRKIIIPLIVVNFSYRWATLKGKPAKIKN